MRRRWIALGFVIVLAIVGAYLGSPYLAVRAFMDAARSADVDKLDAAVDFPAVRESLKSQMSAALMREMNNDPGLKDNPIAGLGTLMMPAIVDKMVDTFVTPDGIAAMIKGSRPTASATERSSADPAVEYEYHYIGLDRFRVKIRNAQSSDEGPSLVFERRGFMTWKLIRIELTTDFMKKTDQIQAAPKPPAAFFPPVGAPAAEKSAMLSDDRLKSRWLALNEECRGGPHLPEDAVCTERDQIGQDLESRGICWAYSDYNVLPTEYRWHPCSQARPAARPN